MVRALRLLLLAVVVVGCGATDPAPHPTGTYQLVAIGGHAPPYVPVVYRLLGGTVPVVGGSVIVGANGILREETRWQDGSTSGSSGAYQVDGNLLYVWPAGALTPAYTFEWDRGNTVRRLSGGEEWRYER